jgi:hypothetical protein
MMFFFEIRFVRKPDSFLFFPKYGINNSEKYTVWGICKTEAGKCFLQLWPELDIRDFRNTPSIVVCLALRLRQQ